MFPFARLFFQFMLKQNKKLVAVVDFIIVKYFNVYGFTLNYWLFDRFLRKYLSFKFY